MPLRPWAESQIHLQRLTSGSSLEMHSLLLKEVNLVLGSHLGKLSARASFVILS